MEITKNSQGWWVILSTSDEEKVPARLAEAIQDLRSNNVETTKVIANFSRFQNNRRSQCQN